MHPVPLAPGNTGLIRDSEKHTAETGLGGGAASPERTGLRAKIPVIREFTGKLRRFWARIGPQKAAKTNKTWRLASIPRKKEQGIHLAGTGNARSDNRERRELNRECSEVAGEVWPAPARHMEKLIS